MSMKNSDDTIGNRTRDLLACSAVPQPTAQPRAPQRVRGEEEEEKNIVFRPYAKYAISVVSVNW